MREHPYLVGVLSICMAIIIGSGAGGATMAKALSEAGHDVMIIERGPSVSGSDAHRQYASVDAGVRLMRTFCLGGTTMVSGGNALRCLEEEMKAFGIDLSTYFSAIEDELGVITLPDRLIGPGTRRLMETAINHGYPVSRMPKFIDPDLCCMDGLCSFGCPTDARWSALSFIRDAEANGARVITKKTVDGVIVHHGEAAGVSAGSKVYHDDLIVLAAGALETPRFLQKLSLPTTPLFADTFVSIGGVITGIEMNLDVPMGFYIPYGGGIILPHYSRQLVSLIHQKGFSAGAGDIIGMMVKIQDDDDGSVNEMIRKGVTVRDAERLIDGATHATALLTGAGVDPCTLVTAPLRGSHPCGTARIGVSVDTNLETAIPGLYVTDASVLPKAPGRPPILAIIALARYASDRMKK